MLSGLSQGEVFGIAQSLFFTPKTTDSFRGKRYGRLLETPLGVAAGPHTQMAQNIVSAWLCGARFLELKTVQVLDELNVTKPCIAAQDEGYNCEWSQELTLDHSFEQYLTAMVLLHVLRESLGHAGPEPGFILNMSAGYDLAGVKSPAMGRFLDAMTHCPDAVRELKERLTPIYPGLAGMELPDKISDNLTLSTMHGCPPDEIERIARHFLEDRGLHTCVKLNPTLLGPDAVRGIVIGELGYPVEIPDQAFAHDLKFAQAVALIASLKESARKSGVHFGVKLTNTLEVVNPGNLPEKEKMLYLSGRALHPVSIALAAKLRDAFAGDLDISFCAGVDAFNVAQVAGTGLNPVTICTDLLKPGGYGRLRQCVETLREAVPVDLAAYAERTAKEPRYRKSAHPYPLIKSGRKLTRFDCAQAPCVQGCSAGQDIPRYMGFAAAGRFDLALATILATNPFPNLLGAVCDRLCQPRCTRINYDEPLRIRVVKRAVAREGEHDVHLRRAEPAGVSVSLRGSGIEGLCCGYYLALAGLDVAVYGPCPSRDAKLLAGAEGAKDKETIVSLGIAMRQGDAPDDALDALGTANGPGGLAAAVGRGRETAVRFLKSRGLFSVLPEAPEDASSIDIQRLALAKATRRFAGKITEAPGDIRTEASRCLRCDKVCSVCVTVCPNRANIALPGRRIVYPLQRVVQSGDGVGINTLGNASAAQLFQVVNLADFCNECGNCASFCPTSGAPYKDKFRMHLSRGSFDAAGEGAWFSGPGRMEALLGRRRVTVSEKAEGLFVETPEVCALLSPESFEALRVGLMPGVGQADLALAAQTAVLYVLASRALPFSLGESC